MHPSIARRSATGSSAARRGRRDECRPRGLSAVDAGFYEMTQGRRGDLGGSGAHGGGGAECAIVLLGEPDAPGKLNGDKTTALASMEWHRPQEPGERIGDADMMRGLSGGRVAHVEYLEHEVDQPRRGCFSIIFEGGEGRRLCVFQILLACVDKAVEMRARQREVADRSRHRLGDGMMANGTTRESGGDVL